jgi:hypothetical protein
MSFNPKNDAFGWQVIVNVTSELASTNLLEYCFAWAEDGENEV